MPTMIRPTWSPETSEQRQLLAEAVRRARRERQEATAKWLTMLKARLAGVPDEVLCDQARESRATLNRRFGTRKDTTVTWAGDNFDEVKVLRPDARLTADGDLELGQPHRPMVWNPVKLGHVVHRQD